VVKYTEDASINAIALSWS